MKIIFLMKKAWSNIYYKTMIMFTRPKKNVPVLKKGMKIAFVCYGNICRSPFAELYASKNYKDYQFYSFGFIEELNRTSTENAVIAAKKWNIDLSSHRSKLLSEKDVEEMKVIFVMDKMNYLMFRNKYKNYLKKVYFLDNEKEIPDPFEKDLQFFEYIYTIISEKIEKLFQLNK
jgi:protein-tyrosine-phosphatase